MKVCIVGPTTRVPRTIRKEFDVSYSCHSADELERVLANPRGVT